MTPCPKPQKPERGTAACKAHMDKVAKLPCMICRAWPVVVHHCICGRYGQSKMSDFDTIPLCFLHHDATSPLGIHASKSAWVKRYGQPDTAYLPEVRRLIEEAA